MIALEIALMNLLKTIANGCLNIVSDLMGTCCGWIFIAIGITTTVVVLYILKRKRGK